MALRVHEIIIGTTVDGPGFRTSIYFAGCKHHCPGCHNPQTWDLQGGYEIDIEQILENIKDAGFDVTLTGGDPFFQKDEVLELCKRIKNLGFNIWAYTGFEYEDIISDTTYKKLLGYIDVLVDGPYLENLRNTDLLFRGSSNQRLIDIRKTQSNGGGIVIWESDF